MVQKYARLEIDNIPLARKKCKGRFFVIFFTKIYEDLIYFAYILSIRHTPPTRVFDLKIGLNGLLLDQTSFYRPVTKCRTPYWPVLLHFWSIFCTNFWAIKNFCIGFFGRKSFDHIFGPILPRFWPNFEPVLHTLTNFWQFLAHCWPIFGWFLFHFLTNFWVI